MGGAEKEKKGKNQGPKKEGRGKDFAAVAGRVSLQARGFWDETRHLLQDEDVADGLLPDEAAALREHLEAIGKVWRRCLWIGGFLLVMGILSPVLRPIYAYVARTPDGRTTELVGLTAPNLTDQAVLSWAATGITEIMTFGFGDFDRRVLAQRPLFTDDGWDSFTQAVRQQNMRAKFKAQQLVLTTVPSNMPVIVSKGVNEDLEHEWIIEMPVIMTYTTNNEEKSAKRGIVRLTLVRVPAKKNLSGLGIKTWFLI